MPEASSRSPITIENISVPEVLADAPDSLAASEAEVWDTEQKRLLDELIEDRKQDRAERKLYAKCLYRLIVGWLIAAAAITLLSAVQLDGQLLYTKFKLQIPEAVILALIGATTVNVLGLFYVVAKYLFPNRGDSPQK